MMRIVRNVIPSCQGCRELGYLAIGYGVRSLGPSSLARFCSSVVVVEKGRKIRLVMFCLINQMCGYNNVWPIGPTK